MCHATSPRTNNKQSKVPQPNGGYCTILLITLSHASKHCSSGDQHWGIDTVQASEIHMYKEGYHIEIDLDNKVFKKIYHC